jgi:hypothetical protein
MKYGIALTYLLILGSCGHNSEQPHGSNPTLPQPAPQVEHNCVTQNLKVEDRKPLALIEIGIKIKKICSENEETITKQWEASEL